MKKNNLLSLFACVAAVHLGGCSGLGSSVKDPNAPEPNSLTYPQQCNVKLKANDYMCNSGKVMAVRREGALVICQKQCAEDANWQQTLDRSPTAMQLRTYDKGGSNTPNAWIWQEKGFQKDLKSLTGK
ncbi:MULTISPECIES: hypothetical protein [Deefgea]|uniref:Lipoprotein n=1 Tax=Deefgea chitinilytica TaxID=570276 RepID=A0ABS2CFX4_9NEIS|nr:MULTISPECIES: hypothetical protein [Deefgea]MBM5572318.1 hypothetical protein [Deefgea chitinilytica]MBM9889554.1 hypothetical protein [Deefgea sp. CFH1-16]